VLLCAGKKLLEPPDRPNEDWVLGCKLLLRAYQEFFEAPTSFFQQLEVRDVGISLNRHASARLQTAESLNSAEKEVLVDIFGHFADARKGFQTTAEAAKRFALRQQLRLALVYLHGRVILQGKSRRSITAQDLATALGLMGPLLLGGSLRGQTAYILATLYNAGVPDVMPANKHAALCFCRIALDAPRSSQDDECDLRAAAQALSKRTPPDLLSPRFNLSLACAQCVACLCVAWCRHLCRSAARERDSRGARARRRGLGSQELRPPQQEAAPVH
jgi:hypothetical protein